MGKFEGQSMIDKDAHQTLSRQIARVVTPQTWRTVLANWVILVSSDPAKTVTLSFIFVESAAWRLSTIENARGIAGSLHLRMDNLPAVTRLTGCYCYCYCYSLRASTRTGTGHSASRLLDYYILKH